jgi:hypothetical protein
LAAEVEAPEPSLLVSARTTEVEAPASNEEGRIAKGLEPELALALTKSLGLLQGLNKGALPFESFGTRAGSEGS